MDLLQVFYINKNLKLITNRGFKGTRAQDFGMESTYLKI